MNNRFDDLKLIIETNFYKNYNEILADIIEAYGRGEIDSIEYMELYEMISRARNEAV
mgnify:CR=1 FL=1